MKGISTKNRIALGQVGLLVSLILIASIIGLIPDRHGAILEGRASLAEVVAANISALAMRSDFRGMEAELAFVIERNPNVISAAVRQDDSGDLLVEVGDHEPHWKLTDSGYSTDTQLQISIWNRNQKWGQLEMRFEPLVAQGWMGMLTNPIVLFVGFIALASFVVFNIYLGRMLKQLDPSQAVPSRVRAALDTMAEGLLVLDRKERVVLANQAFSAMLGKSSDTLLGFDAARFPWVTLEDSMPTGEWPWRQAMRDGELKKNTMMRLKISENETRTLIVNCSPVLGAKDKSSGVLVSFEDVTQLEQKEIALRKSMEEAKSANQAKSDFLANMSHEIRTPMNAILGFTEILIRGYGNNKHDAARHLQTIQSSGKFLLNLINDILDLSKIEAGRLEFEKIQIAPHKIIQEVVKILEVKAREKGIALEFQPDGPIPATITSDPGRLRQIVTNLVGNAIKFTDDGSVKVVLRLAYQNQQPRLVIDVSDSGIGMPEDKLESIFNPFEQADSSITRRFGGTGLGLAISRRFARALGGDITVQSTVGVGSTFTVSIDPGSLEGIELLQPAEVLRVGENTSGGSFVRWKFQPANVLVVDDSNENRELVILVLEEQGLHVHAAENGKAAVDKILSGAAYDVILMDVQMPVMDGFTATALLREQGVETPIIALTGHAMKGYEQKCLDAGFTGYMTKPIDIDELSRKIATLIGGELITQSPLAGVEIAGSISDCVGASNSSGEPIFSRLSASNPRFRSLIERFITELKTKLVAIEEAFHNKDYDELARLAHWLKGTGGTVGFDMYTKPALNLEQSAKAGDSTKCAEVIAVLIEMANRTKVSAEEENIELVSFRVQGNCQEAG